MTNTRRNTSRDLTLTEPLATHNPSVQPLATSGERIMKTLLSNKNERIMRCTSFALTVAAALSMAFLASRNAAAASRCRWPRNEEAFST